MNVMRRFPVLLANSSALAICLSAVPAYAQSQGQPQGTSQQTAEATQEDEEALQRNADGSQSESGAIVVTGSRIPRPAFEGTIPGAQVTEEQITARAFTNTLDVLNDIPLVGPGASPFGTNGGQPASLGAAFVDLLDLGTNRTLTLVNGRRYVSGNAATLFVAGNVTGSQVDLNTIPTALLSRIDVLTVGGSVAYGSDAVAGVVNAILRDDYEGIQVTGLSGISHRGDAGVWRLTAVAGMNFGGDRGNVAVSFEANHDDALTGDRRRGFALNLVAPTSFRNGAVRNSAFTPSLTVSAAAGTGAFLPAASDLVPNNIAGSGYPGGTILYSAPGAIFAINANVTNFFPGVATGGQGIATTDPQAGEALAPSFRPLVLISSAGNVNLVPGTPIAPALAGCSVANLANFCNFAPNALPAGTAAQQTAFANAVVARFAPAFVGQGTQAQRNTLAVQLLAANIQTPREFLANNPGTDINAFIGSLVTNSSGTTTFLRVPNTDPATRTLLPFVARPLQFDAAGNVVQVVPAVIGDPRDTPSTTGGAVGGAGFNPSRYTNLRVRQDRYIANLIAHFDVNDWLTVYTENQYARVENISPVNFASRNSMDVTSAENATLVMNINNPYLDVNDRAALSASGVTGPFILSRTNQDIVGDNAAQVNSDTYRTVLGVRGGFGLFGRPMNYDTSFTYGRSEATGTSFQIKDIEYALAIDAVATPGGIACRATTNPGAYIGRTPPGVAGTELVREMGPDGIIVERIVRRTATADQVAGCQPLNVFGYNQMTDAAREYVLARTGFTNLSEQYFGQASLSGSFFDLPGGPLGFALVGEFRRESLAYEPDELSRLGRTRTAALATTEGFIETWELGAEARIPIFGEGFSIPAFRNLDVTPGVRFVRQSGDAPDVRLLSGNTITQESPGTWNTIWSIAGSWRPVRDVTFRGNVTRSIRQPSIVELFLGGQPAFTGVSDPCSTGNINLGTRPTTRRANCEAAVIAAGLATNQAGAAAFLNTYVPSGANITGTFAGSPDLQPERGRSWTVGGVLTPRFVPGRLQLSADYIDVELRNQIIPTTIVTALQVCYDSPAFPDTTPEVGVNTCNFFQRIAAGADRQFEVNNGFNSGFINLGALRVKAVNITGIWDFPVEELFGPRAGSFQIYANAYHLINYLNSSSGNFGDGGTTDSAGTFSRPDWEVQLRGRYENQGFFAQWTWNWQPETRIFTVPVAGTDTQNETQDLLRLDGFGIHDAAIGYSFGEDRRFGVQLSVRNAFDKQIAGPFNQVYGLATSGRIDDIGRRIFVTANVRF
jgi:outer membrane receptor protein involved in Fe transport